MEAPAMTFWKVVRMTLGSVSQVVFVDFAPPPVL